VDDPEEHACLHEYLFQIFSRQGSTETVLFLQFDCGLHAKMPLQSASRLANPDLPFPISFVYGSKDWMDSRGSRQIVRASKFFESGESQLHLLDNATHQMFVTNPAGVAQVMIDNLLGNVTHQRQFRLYSYRYVDDEGNETYLDDEEI
jgi:pimeloyl-ACP methyl ester carboxylesterase